MLCGAYQCRPKKATIWMLMIRRENAHACVTSMEARRARAHLRARRLPLRAKCDAAMYVSRAHLTVMTRAIRASCT